MQSRAANGVDGEPALPWLMSGVTMQHPVLLDEATAARLGYGSTCMLGPARAVIVPGDGCGSRRRGDAPGDTDAVEGEDAVPEVGGTFRMWSDYRMSLEGHAGNVQAGTLLTPALDAARTVADSFRRRWASGGQYPERVLARVHLAERGASDEDLPPPPSEGRDVGDSRGRADSGMPPEKEEGMIDNTVGSGTARVDKRRARKMSEGGGSPLKPPDGVASPSTGGSDGGGADPEENGEGKDMPAGGGLRNVFSQLDGLDSGILIERALEDLHEEDSQSRMPLSSTLGGVVDEGAGSRAERQGRLSSIISDIHTDVEADAAGVIAALECPPVPAAVDAESLSAALGKSTRESLVVPSDAADQADAETVRAATLVGTETASPEGGSMNSAPTAEKFMLPRWHYLYLSGRALSMDFRWSNVDLILMQDPNARQGRDTDKNVLALRSSGALTVRSSGTGESVDAQLEGASLLPCFYTAEGDEEEGVPSETDDDAASTRFGSRVGKDGARDVDAAPRLALLLGGGSQALAAVARTWLGQGLSAADSRPLLEPFMVQMGYGTVVAQASLDGHATGVTDGRGLLEGRRSDDGGIRSRMRNAKEGLEAESESEEEGENGEGLARQGTVDQRGSGEMVAGVFRVGVSELQPLVAQPGLKGLATIEVEVSFCGSKWRVQALSVLQGKGTTIANELTVLSRYLL